MKKNLFRNLVDDLLTLEINTIVKENTTSAKMPATKRIALYEIADSYRTLLINYGLCKLADGKQQPAVEPGKHQPILLRWHFGGEYSFDEIRVAAGRGIAIFEKKLEKDLPEGARERIIERLNLLQRLQSQSANLLGMFKSRRKDYGVYENPNNEGLADRSEPDLFKHPAHEPFPSQIISHIWNNDLSVRDINRHDDIDLPPDQVTLVRKTWEIGIQQVLMQTVIQIDGDITCYISPELVAYRESVRKTVLEMHQESTTMATKSWSVLFSTLGHLAETVFRIFFPGQNKKA